MAATPNAILVLSVLLVCDHVSASPLSAAIDLTHRVAENYTLAWPSSDPFRFRIVHRGDTARFKVARWRTQDDLKTWQ